LPAAVGEVNARQAWRKHVTRLLDSALDRNDAALEQVSAALAAAIAGGRHVYAFGAGHSLSLVTEMHRRAGSLKGVRPIWNPELTSQQDGEAVGRLESAAGYYAKLTADLDWGPGDLCWVISNSGRNVLVVEFAQEAKRRGVAVIALTSVEHSTSVPPAPGLPRLLDIADYVLDNAGRLGDASLDLPGLAEAMAPTSTITGAALVHAAWAGAAEKLVAAGHVPEVWGSVNRAPSIPDARSS
jgi:uncharacterized phosphosugar-binding protein